MDGSDQLVAHLYASVGQLDARRFRRSYWRGTLAKNVPRLLSERRSPFPFVQADRSLGGGSRPRGIAGGTQDRRQCETCVGVIDQSVGALGQADSSLGDPPSLVVIIAARQQPCPKRAPGDRCLQRVAGESLTLRTQFVGLGISVERETGATQ